jgi:hypothetical protein
MEQLLLHLLGDYILQPRWMAINKSKSTIVALAHVLIYSIPFFALTDSWYAIMVILLTHLVIDRFSLAKYWIYLCNSCIDERRYWRYSSETGFQDQIPDFHGYVPKHIAFFLYAVTDNAFHLLINYAALRWL